MLDKAWKILLCLTCLCVLITALMQVASFFSAIMVLLSLALLAVYILLAPVNFLHQSINGLIYLVVRLTGFEKLKSLIDQHATRALSVILMYLVSAVLALLLCFRFAPLVWHELQLFSAQLPSYIESCEEWLLSQPWTRQYFHHEVEKLQQNGSLKLTPEEWHLLKQPKRDGGLNSQEKAVIRDNVFHKKLAWEGFLNQHAVETFNNIGRLLGITLTGVVYLLTGLVLTFYLLLDGVRLKDNTLSLLPVSWQEPMNLLVNNFHSVMFGFIKSQVLLGMGTGTFMVFVYLFFDVPYAFFLGAFFAIAEILPVVGTWIGFTPGILVLLFTNPLKLVVVMAIVYVFQTIKDNIIAPKIMGDIMGLHPLVVILSLLICAKSAGIIGILFAIPVASMINVLIRFFQKKEMDRFSR